MRKCRKMISMIMLMVMLVSLTPYQALAAEAPTGNTSTETAAVEEPQTTGTEGDANMETPAPEDSSEGTSVSDAVDKDAEKEVEEPADATSSAATTTETAAEEEPTDGITSTEIAPVEETIEKEEMAASINLTPYITSMAVLKGTTPLEPDDDGGYTLDEGTYTVVLRSDGKRFTGGTYTYTLPSEFTYAAVEGNDIIKIDGTVYGTFSVSGNVLTLVMEDSITEVQDIRISFSFSMTATYIDGRTVYLGEVPIKVNMPEVSHPTIEKGVSSTVISRDSASDGTEHYQWNVKVTSEEDATAVGTKVVDRIGTESSPATSGGLHQFLDYDKNRQITVTATHGSDTAVWKIPDSSNTYFSWINGTDGTYGWSYVIPDKAPSNASKGAGTVFGNGWDFRFDFTTSMVKDYMNLSPGNGYNYPNAVHLYEGDQRTDWDETYIHRVRPGGSSYNKGDAKWLVNSDGELEYTQWTLTSKMRGYAPTDLLRLADSYRVGGLNDINLGANTPAMELVSATITFTKDGTSVTENLKTSSSEASESGYYLQISGTSWYLRNVNYEGRAYDGSTASGVDGNANMVITYKQKFTTAVREALETK